MSLSVAASQPAPSTTVASTSRRDALRVAMVIQRFRPRFSGHGEQVELLCRVLARRGIESTIITSAYERPTSTESHDGYRVARLGSTLPHVAAAGVSRWSGPAFAARVLAHLWRDGNFDVVHVHAPTDALYASWLWCHSRRRPLLFEMTLLGTDDAVTMMRRRERFADTRRAIFGRCDGYVAISPALAEKYREAGLPPHKLRLVPQGVDVRQFRPAEDREAVRVALGLPKDGPLLMFVGSLIHRKGIDLVLGAWQRIHAVRRDAHLVLVGQNRFPHDARAEEFLDGLRAVLPTGAGRHVHELGLRSDVHELLPAADLFVFPSRREGFGTVMIEAMACGLPCIVAEQPGITDFIFGHEGGGGVVVPHDDQAIADAALAVLSNSSLAEAFGREARRRAVERFDIEHIADCYIDFYQDLVAHRRGGGARH